MREIDSVLDQAEAVSEIQENESILKIGAKLFSKIFMFLKEHKKVVYCEQCEYRYDGHYEKEGEEPYIKSHCMCKYGLPRNYRVEMWDFCSRGEIQGSSDEKHIRFMLREGEEENYDIQRKRRN